MYTYILFDKQNLVKLILNLDPKISVWQKFIAADLRPINKPNKPVYFSMRSITAEWDSVWFIGLIGFIGLFLHCLFFHAFSQ